MSSKLVPVSHLSNSPVERLEYKQPPYKNVGLDYFGPLYVEVCRSTEKRWGLFFNGLTTRAVHFEIAPFLDSISCVMDIERFIMRRGTPSTIWSGYGTIFVGAEKSLLAYIKKWSGMAPTIFAHKSVAQKFNPPGAVHPID